MPTVLDYQNAIYALIQNSTDPTLVLYRLVATDPVLFMTLLSDEGLHRGNVRQLYSEQKYVSAIMYVREHMGLGLKDAKTKVDAWVADMKQARDDQARLQTATMMSGTMERLTDLAKDLAGSLGYTPDQHDTVEGLLIFLESEVSEGHVARVYGPGGATTGRIGQEEEAATFGGSLLGEENRR